MKISNKTEYGIRALMYLAQKPEGYIAAVQEIAEAEQVSFHFLEKILVRMKKSGLLCSHRGMSGGYSLARGIDKITMKEVIESLEGAVVPFERLVSQKTFPRLHCKSHLTLSLVQQKFVESMHAVTLKHLIQ